MKRSILIIVFFVAFVSFANAQTDFRGNELKDFQGMLEIAPSFIKTEGYKTRICYFIKAKKSCWVKMYIPRDGGCLVCDDGEYKLLGVYYFDDNVRNYSEIKCLDGGVWSDVKCFAKKYLKKGDWTVFELCYSGALHEGITDVKTIRGLHIAAGNKTGTHLVGQIYLDPIRIYHEVEEDTTSLTSEELIKEIIDENNDGYCGIYEQGYTKYACVKNNEEYSLIYMSGSIYDWWSLGDVKARFTLKDDGEAACTHWINDRRALRHAKIQFNEEGMFADNIEYKRIYPTENSDMACRLYARINAKKAIGAAVDKLNDEMYNDALRILTQTTNMDFLDKDYHYYVYMLRAYTYTMMIFYKSAIEDYTKALEYKPEDEDAYYARGMLKLQLQDVTGIDDLKQSGEWGRAILREADLLDYDTSKPLLKEQVPTLEKQSIPQLKKTNR